MNLHIFISTKISNLHKNIFNDKFYERINNGVRIANSTINIPIVSINPNSVPKIKYDKMTEATGSIAAVTEASSGVK